SQLSRTRPCISRTGSRIMGVPDLPDLPPQTWSRLGRWVQLMGVLNQSANLWVSRIGLGLAVAADHHAAPSAGEAGALSGASSADERAASASTQTAKRAAGSDSRSPRISQ